MRAGRSLALIPLALTMTGCSGAAAGPVRYLALGDWYTIGEAVAALG